MVLGPMTQKCLYATCIQLTVAVDNLKKESQLLDLFLAISAKLAGRQEVNVHAQLKKDCQILVLHTPLVLEQKYQSMSPQQ